MQNNYHPLLLFQEDLLYMSTNQFLFWPLVCSPPKKATRVKRTTYQLFEIRYLYADKLYPLPPDGRSFYFFKGRSSVTTAKRGIRWSADWTPVEWRVRSPIWWMRIFDPSNTQAASTTILYCFLFFLFFYLVVMASHFFLSDSISMRPSLFFCFVTFYHTEENDVPYAQHQLRKRVR